MSTCRAYYLCSHRMSLRIVMTAGVIAARDKAQTQQCILICTLRIVGPSNATIPSKNPLGWPLIVGLMSVVVMLGICAATGMTIASCSRACLSCRWAVYKSPSDWTWTYGQVPSMSQECQCSCEPEECLVDGKAPMKHASGLATQHVCGNSIERLSEWHQVWIPAKNTGMHAACMRSWLR